MKYSETFSGEDLLLSCTGTLADALGFLMDPPIFISLTTTALEWEHVSTVLASDLEVFQNGLLREMTFVFVLSTKRLRIGIQQLDDIASPERYMLSFRISGL